VLLFDDVHWADDASRELLVDLIGGLGGGACLLLCAYRNEPNVDGARVSALLEEAAATRSLPVTRIELGGLDSGSARRMLAEALGRPAGRIECLAETVQRRTGNNPLLIQQFVLHVHGLGLIRFAEEEGWTWDDAAIAQAEIPEGAVPMLVAKLQGFDPVCREVIELASCIRDRFDAPGLAEFASRPAEELEPALFSLAEQGLLVACSGGYAFVHERVREAAQSMLSDDARAQLHARIGQTLLARLSEDERASRVLQLAAHLDRGVRFLPEARRLDVIRIDAAAGRRALQEGDPFAARSFLATGRTLWREDDWPEHAALGFALATASIECETLCGAFPEALALAGALEQRPLAPLQRAEVASRKIRILALTEEPRVGTRYALEVLRGFGVHWPEVPPSVFVLRLRVLRLLWRMRGRRIANAWKRADQIDPGWVAPIVVISAAGTLMARADVRFGSLSACHVLSSTLRHGYVARPGYTLSGFALVVNSLIELSPWVKRFARALGDLPDAERLERTALDWQRHSPDPVYDPRSEFFAYGVLRAWRAPRRSLLPELARVARAAHEAGDLEYANYAEFVRILFSVLVGDPVPQVLAELAELCRRVRSRRIAYVEPRSLLRPCELLQRDRRGLDLDAELEEAQRELTGMTPVTASYASTAWLLVCCVFGRWDLACSQADPFGSRLGAYAHSVDFVLYRSLAAGVLAERSVGSARRRSRRLLRRGLRFLRGRGAEGPDFTHMAQLLEGESHRLGRRFGRAVGCYQRATRTATEASQPHHAALAQERLAELLLALGRRSEAKLVLSQASTLYRAWGATGKAEGLAQRLASRDF
jgi:hypothetical protein